MGKKNKIPSANNTVKDNNEASKKLLSRFDSKLDEEEMNQISSTLETTPATLQSTNNQTTSTTAASASKTDKEEHDYVDEEMLEERKERRIYQNLTFWIYFFALFFALLAVYLYITKPISRPVPKNPLHNKPRVMITPVDYSKRLYELETYLSKPALKVHMLWTTPESTFQPRNAKVIDSYLYHHPDAEINIYASHLKSDFFQDYTDAGYNVKVTKLDDEFLTEMSNHCPGKSWVDSISKWKEGKYFYSHITDYVRFCALYRWGGLYSDFDAITLNRLDTFKNFIGRDSAMSNYTCHWCVWQDDIYLPPGVMATEKNHILVKRALEIGFGSGDYNPEIFNSVGPMAVTKAYNELSKELPSEAFHIYQQHELYPYNYLNSDTVFVSIPDATGKFERIKHGALSLHLYGHQTSNLPIAEDSILTQAFDFFSVVGDEKKIKAPAHLAVGKLLEEVPDIRILGSDGDGPFNLDLKTRYGRIKISNDDTINNSEFSKSISFTSKSNSEANRKLSRLIYYSLELPSGRDTISILLNGKLVAEIPVYDVTQLVTIIVKTVGRIDKVISLAQSVRKYYQTVYILVADDHKNPYRGEGPSREFYYLPLPDDVGLSAGRNRMVERVKTEYFLTLDDDFTMDPTSRLGVLLHALESTPQDGSEMFDIAAGKNPIDEGKFDLDFCGFMTIQDSILYLHEGEYGVHQGCNHVDFVPNIFLGRTSTFKNVIKWDELLKLGEHEDFFLRAKEKGVKTLTCPGVTFIHDQVDHWLKRDEYEVKRSRVFDFWRLSMRKHGLEKINSFGRIMMDMIEPLPVSDLTISNILAKSLTISWTSECASYKIMYTEVGRDKWRPVNDGQGEEYYGRDSITVTNLKPDHQYEFRVYAGNGFDFEGMGVSVAGETLSRRDERAMNLIENASFEKGHFGYKGTIGGIYHIVRNESTSGDFSGRIQILTNSYRAKTPTHVHFEQTIPETRILKKRNPHFNNNKKTRALLFSASSKMEQLFGWTSWRIELHVWFKQKEKGEEKSPSLPRRWLNGDMIERNEFDMSVISWHMRTVSICLAPTAEIEQIQVRGVLESYRGAVYFDDLVVVEKYL